MTDRIQDYINLAESATDRPWDISWYRCRMNANDVAYAKKEGNPNAKIGDIMWRSAKSIGPVSPEHDHWSGTSLGCIEEDAQFIAESRTLGPAMAKALIEAEGALQYAHSQMQPFCSDEIVVEALAAYEKIKGE